VAAAFVFPGEQRRELAPETIRVVWWVMRASSPLLSVWGLMRAASAGLSSVAPSAFPFGAPLRANLPHRIVAEGLHLVRIGAAIACFDVLNSAMNNMGADCHFANYLA
jgi:hypothetical protein